jgi:hypothetical protein
MRSEMILLRIVNATREGWKCMPLRELLRRINLASWDGQELVGWFCRKSAAMRFALTVSSAGDPYDHTR